MRMSCNGCRVLRKACSGSCLLKTCLQWIPSPESQANATVFLAKFYGRAGLLNLISAASLEHRQETFRSLLYEACGRVINPVDGAVGLLTSGNWALCQAAVDAVLQGSPITAKFTGEERSFNCDAKEGHPFPYGDIRRMNKVPSELHPVRIRNHFKLTPEVKKFTITEWGPKGEEPCSSLRSQIKRVPSSDDSFSVETVEPSLLNPSSPPTLELTLGP